MTHLHHKITNMSTLSSCNCLQESITDQLPVVSSILTTCPKREALYQF